jgi:hypothetical protein
MVLTRKTRYDIGSVQLCAGRLQVCVLVSKCKQDKRFVRAMIAYQIH